MGHVTQLDDLEDEAIFILREVAARFERPALLFSGGKDSLCLVRLSEKAFRPGRFPYPLLHIDTGHNFDETLAFRDALVQRLDERLIIRSVEDSIKAGRVHEERGASPSRNALQSVTLLDAISEHRFDACIGGARRDEEKARAKERIFSLRDEHGQWNPKAQRPELGRLFNTRLHEGEHMRVFPLSNWTELDVWQYIAREQLEVPSIYFSHERPCIERDGVLMPASTFIPMRPGELAKTMRVRFRTVGDMTCTGAHVSTAGTVDDIIAEISAARTSERGTRADDQRSETAMEDRKRQGYF